MPTCVTPTGVSRWPRTRTTSPRSARWTFCLTTSSQSNQVSTVGEDVRLVERVLGRWTIARAAGTGALSGAWFGLLIGLLFAIFVDTGWFAVILVATAIGP